MQRLPYNALGDKGVLALCQSPIARSLRVLELGHNRLGAKAAAAIASSENLAGLERLYLNEPKFDDEVAQLLEQSATLRKTQLWVNAQAQARSGVRCQPGLEGLSVKAYLSSAGWLRAIGELEHSSEDTRRARRFGETSSLQVTRA
ncbi:MAG: hypothetical protein QM765_32825 [Myxococcales bacterium]